MNKELYTLNMIQFKKAYDFLINHPAFGYDFNDSLLISPQAVCVNGYTKTKTISICKDHKKFNKLWELYKDRTDRLEVYTLDLEKKEIVTKDEVDSIEADYEDIFGAKWSFHKIELWIELYVCRYYVSENSNIVNHNKFELGGISADTYEEGIIKLAKILKKKCGNYQAFKDSTFKTIPAWIEENNKLINWENYYQSKNQKYVYAYLTEADYNTYWWIEKGFALFPDRFDEQYFQNSEQWYNVEHLKDIESFKNRKKYCI